MIQRHDRRKFILAICETEIDGSGFRHRHLGGIITVFSEVVSCHLTCTPYGYVPCFVIEDFRMADYLEVGKLRKQVNESTTHRKFASS